MADTEPTFEVGLVLAGAVSAGAYSAGVIDFIVEALDAYEAARTTGMNEDGTPWTGPTHAVRVPVMAGASAGGMTAAMAALQVYSDFDHCGPGRRPASPERNRLYASWVDEIDIGPLLDTRDLANGARLRSVLSCRVLDEIVARTLDLKHGHTRPWLGRGGSNALAVMFTVSDTGGVPYQFRIAGAESGSEYTMLNHSSSMRFVVGPAPDMLPEHADFERLDLADPASPARARFGTAALATGAFPIGLAPRPLDRNYSDYMRGDQVGREWIMPDGSLVFVPTLPVPPPNDRPTRHRFVAVDGGVIDNEPLELARRFLSGRATQNPSNRNGRETRYAMVLIDPFPNRAAWPQENADAFLSAVAPSLVSMLVNQARFKPQELTLALDASVFSRFAILPEPVTRTPDSLALPIACGALSGFSGFLDRSFRHHDYCLGRRNAQAFLRSYFCLPETNPLFDAWKAAGGEPAEWYIAQRAADGSTAAPVRAVREAVPTATVPNPRAVPALPIIPLTPQLRREIALGPDDRPRMPTRRELRTLEGRFGVRFDAVVERLVDDEIADLVPGGWLGRKVLKQFLPGIARRKAMASVTTALAEIRRAFPDG